MAPTDDELEQTISEEMKQRVSAMTNEEAAQRHEKLRAKVVAVKPPTGASEGPTEVELQEYHLLKRRLVD